MTNDYFSDNIIDNQYENYIEKDNILIEKLQNTEQNFIFTYNNEDYIGFNCWCLSVSLGNSNSEMNVYNLENDFKNRLIEVIQKYNLNLIINKINKIDLLPNIPNIITTSFDNWYVSNTDKVLIYIYNYIPRSYNGLGSNIINNFIKYLANKYASNNKILFIVPKYNIIFQNYKNILYCDLLFDSIEKPDCYNLLINNKIAQKCKIIITIPSGSTWLFLNNSITEQSSIKYMLTPNGYSKYVWYLNNWYKYCTNNMNNIISNINFYELDNLIYSL